MRKPLALIVVAATLAVSGCADKGLKQIRSKGTGPDEFSVLPARPLTAPADYQFLPAPTPGGSNLTDPDPVEDAVVALGGNAAALKPGQGVPSTDNALVVASSRYGVPAGTRQELAEEDAKFRKRQARLSNLKLFNVDRYEQAYRSQTLDPYKQVEGYRQRGYATPAAPPFGE